jgi:predicted transcriptional regulator
VESLKAQDIMNKELQAVNESTSIEEVLNLMEEKHLLNIPVVKNGIVVETLSRHDLLRATLGVDFGIEHH